MNEYLTSVDSKAYIVATDFLHKPVWPRPGERYTDMRLADMIVDSFLVAGGRANGLRFLGINWIVDLEARISMFEAFEDATAEQKSSVKIQDKRAKVVTLAPSADSGNPFVKCASRVAEALSAASGETIIFKTVNLVRERESNAHHMVCEFEQQACRETVVDKDETPKKTGMIQRAFSKKGRGTLRRTLSHILGR